MCPITKLLIILLIVESYQCADYKVTDQVYFDMVSEGKYLGRIVVGLFGEVLPKTVANFKQIATNGIKGKTYENSKIHRVIERFLIQGGDIVHNNGSGSVSIYGKYFKDEDFIIKHNGPGIVSMANGGRNTNGCQFFITTVPTPWLDTTHVAFGKIIRGQDIVHKIEHFKSNVDDSPLQEVIIARSGMIKTKKPFYENDDPFELTFWAWIKAGWFPISFSFLIMGFFQWIMTQLNNLKSFN